MVATHPQFRRRGFGWAVTWAALNEGRRMRLEIAALRRAQMSESQTQIAEMTEEGVTCVS